MATVQQMVTQILSEGQFDASQDSALAWLDARHKKMVARSRCYRRTVVTATTAPGQRDYPLPVDLLELTQVNVGGVDVPKTRNTDLSHLADGTYALVDPGGSVFAGDEDAGGALELAFFPTPDTGGKAITIRGSFLPPDLSIGDNTTLKVPADFHEALVSGAMATALARLENRMDMSNYYDQLFADACEELRRQVNRRLRGPGPARIRFQTA